MHHIQSLENVQVNNAWLTIGSFDGIHLGHQALIRELTAGAHGQNAPAIVLTFHPHPAVILGRRKKAKYLITPNERAAILEKLGVDMLITHPFNREIAAQTADVFLDNLQAHLGFRHLWVGHDFAMGHNRSGDVPALVNMGEKMGFDLHIIPPVKVNGEVVSSSYIRALLAEGDITKTNQLLDRQYSLQGEVIRGKGRGKLLGIPTANLNIWKERAIPGTGVYICQAHTAKGVWGAVANIGMRPTFQDKHDQPTIEAHVLNFTGDLYGENLKLTFIDRLRGEKRFPNPAALVTQIHADIAQAREHFVNTRK
jgi:riboflavin kinase/FMN adenylyltransferase